MADYLAPDQPSAMLAPTVPVVTAPVAAPLVAAPPAKTPNAEPAPAATPEPTVAPPQAEMLDRIRGENLWNVAQEKYPILKNFDVQYAYRPPDYDPSVHGGIEFLSPEETERFEGMPVGKNGIAVYDPNITPLDILGDMVSHHMVNEDPTVKKVYDDFVKTLTPEQWAELRAEYSFENPNLKETDGTIPQDWLERVGYPSAFRGYLFNQWPVDQYTGEQKQLLDTLKPYLGLTNGK